MMVLQSKVEYYIKLLRNILFLICIVMLLFALNAKRSYRREIVSQISESSLKYLLFKKPASNNPRLDVDQIKRLIHSKNSEQKILNTDIFEPLKEDAIIFVITVSTFSIYLEFLLVSLSQVKGIEDALIIFSHLYYDENVSHLIQSIDFCRVLQVYYPYSIQVYTLNFPGYHWNDCPFDMSMEHAEYYNCSSAESPDIHGHYRDPILAEKKNFWWWTANTVFGSLNCTSNHTGSVVFLKEDLYLLHDAVYMILTLKHISETLRHGEFLSLNAIPYSNENKAETYDVKIITWDPPDDPDVFGLDRAAWKGIVDHYDAYCSLDDYSWARSLYFVSLHREGKQFRMLSSVLPRAFKTSTCGLRGHLLGCSAIESVYHVLRFQKELFDELFPQYFEIDIRVDLEEEYPNFDYFKSNGGFNDPRDKDFCRNLTTRNPKNVLLEMQKGNFESVDILLY